MNRHRTTIIRRAAISLAALLLAAAFAFAHGGLEHVIGTVAKVSPDSVTVTTTAGKTVEVVLAAKTTYSKADQTIQQTDIQVGDRVVIHAEKEGGRLIAHTVAVGVAKKVH